MNNYVEGVFKNRPNRFIAEVLINNELVKAHVPNTGRCKELLVPDAKVFLLPSNNPKRKTKYSLHFVLNKGVLVSLFSQQANEIVFNSIKQGIVGELQGYNVLEREKTIDNSRIDIYLGKSKDGNIFEDCYVEVKGVTLIKDGLAQFPDAPTERGRKHLNELIELKKRGHRAAVFFLIQHPKGDKFRPNWENDPDFAKILNKAYSSGVEILVYKCENSLDGITMLNKSLSFDLSL
ncbi:DNA/RNA nuclease SfsA [Methanobrevibacter acididurans]|uniref:DNA/RNA nuclease SfsA n=1 Tax=Methanobrevibacter acididurans TaxID=120963 RepID=UPI0038FC802F